MTVDDLSFVFSLQSYSKKIAIRFISPSHLRKLENTNIRKRSIDVKIYKKEIFFGYA